MIIKRDHLSIEGQTSGANTAYLRETKYWTTTEYCEWKFIPLLPKWKYTKFKGRQCYRLGRDFLVLFVRVFNFINYFSRGLFYLTLFPSFIGKLLIYITVYIKGVLHDGLIYMYCEMITTIGSPNIHFLIQIH